MNKDRGTMKWTALMLPEHIQRLREWDKEMKKVQPKQWSDWELQTLNDVIYEAYVEKNTVTFTIYKKNRFAHITGIIQIINQQKRQLLIQTDATITAIHFDTIQAVDDND